MNSRDHMALIRSLRHVADFYVHSQGHGGLEALRLVRLAGQTWADLLPGAPFADPEEIRASLQWGFRSHPSPETFARAIRALIGFATGYELAVAVVLLADMDPLWPDHDRAERLQAGIDILLTRCTQLARTPA